MASNANPPTARVSDVIASFRPTRLFKPPSTLTPLPYITSLDFDDTGELALISRTDETLQLYNCAKGAHAKELKSQKYGVQLARFTHHAQSIIYASTKLDDAIRYLSTHDNSYLRYFKGHTGQVTSLSLSPSSDQFLSSSADNTVKLWNLQTSNPTGELRLHAPYLTAYDPCAIVVAIASPPTQSILLYDLRNYDKAPFACFEMRDFEAHYTPKSQGRDWTKLEFSNDGKMLLLGTNGFGHFLLDAFDGQLKAFAVRKANTGRVAPGSSGHHPSSMNSSPVSTGGVEAGVSSQGDVCFSPDARYLVGGSGREDLLVWDMHADVHADKILEPMVTLPNKHPAAVVGYNPRHNLIITGDRDLVFWLPDPDSVP